MQSLAKWKRLALADLRFAVGEGIYTDMNAVRPDDPIDNTHSIYVDQWDWEMVIAPEQRTTEFLETIVRTIYDLVRRTERFIAHEYEELEPYLPDEIRFVRSIELASTYPDLSPRERVKRVCREYGAVFITDIGAVAAVGVAAAVRLQSNHGFQRIHPAPAARNETRTAHRPGRRGG